MDPSGTVTSQTYSVYSNEGAGGTVSSYPPHEGATHISNISHLAPNSRVTVTHSIAGESDIKTFQDEIGKFWGAARKVAGISALIFLIATGALFTGDIFHHHYVLSIAAGISATAFIASTIAACVFWYKKSWYESFEKGHNYLVSLFAQYGKSHNGSMDWEKMHAAHRYKQYSSAKNWFAGLGISLTLLGALIYVISTVGWVQANILHLDQTVTCSSGMHGGEALFFTGLGLSIPFGLCLHQKKKWKKLAGESSATVRSDSSFGITPHHGAAPAGVSTLMGADHSTNLEA